MYLKLVRVRHNGEQFEDESDDFKDDLEEVRKALDKWVPGVYSAYWCYDRQGNLVLSKGLFGECKEE